jgi:two-component system nitrogen regulation sensor histidine kinase NtrY
LKKKKDTKTKLDPQEALRRRRERYIIIIVAFLIIALTFLESYFSKTREQIPITNNLLVYFLLNVNILLLVLLIFLVIRNVVKLFFERKRGILGSKLRTKLVASFVGLSIAPTLLLFWVSAGFITNTIDNWFSFQLEKSLEESLEVAQTYYQKLTQDALFFANNIGQSVRSRRLLLSSRRNQLQKHIEAMRGEYNVGAIEVFSSPPAEKSVAAASNLSVPHHLEPSSDLLLEALSGKEITKIQSLGAGDLIRGIAPINSIHKSNKIVGIVVVSYYIPQGLVKKMTGVSNAYSDYRRLKLTQHPIKANYIIFLSIVTLLIIFSAIMFGFHLAKNITGPIKELAEGTQEVAEGNLDVHIDVTRTDDEIGSLVESFNKMTQDLKTGKSQLEHINLNLKETNLELEQRRKYMEIVLKNVAAGVVSLDKQGRITTINKSAGEILGVDVESVLDKDYRRILPNKYLQQAEDVIQEVDRNTDLTFTKEVKVTFPKRTLDLTTHVTSLKDETGEYLGLVIVIEDVTELQKAQRVAAWREVARRIAHEIKNPLTPIQLSAQRLRRRYQDKFFDDGKIFNECTNTIINQVEILKNMVNEFYNFARMPSTKPSPSNLNQIINETLPLYREAHKGVAFRFESSENVPTLLLDKDQIKRALINILDNAVAALNKKGEVIIRTFYDATLNLSGVEIADNGCGIIPEEKSRMFEPYFSTKKSGTGLGLAIVNSIISDHHGYIRVNDNHPKGTVFRIELPVRV